MLNDPLHLCLVNEFAAVDFQVGGTGVWIAEVHLGSQSEVVVEKLPELHHHGCQTSGNFKGAMKCK